MNRVAVFGASGFVGTELVERLSRQGYEVRPLINSGRNAWRLARLGIDLACVDVLDPAQVDRAIEGCTHVVNCILGSDRAMLEGLKNQLAACERRKVERFVHLSSITVYGEPPPPDSVHEGATPRPKRGTYGWVKMQQDDLVAQSARRGLSSAILCPPIVSGPYSTQLLCLVDAIRKGKFAIVDEGRAPCSLVDVRNLAQAIQLALENERVEASRSFIVDEHCATWSEVVESLSPLIGSRFPLPKLTADEAQWHIDSPRRIKRSPLRTLRRLASGEVRAAMRSDPLYASVEGWASRTARRYLPPKMLAKLRNRKPVDPRSRISTVVPDFDRLFLARQMRGVRHSSARARESLGYVAEVSFDESMQRFCNWYAGMHGWNDSHADLIEHLESL